MAVPSVYDVIVVGLGGMGSAAAYRLAERGQRVLGLERFWPAHDQGSSHGGSRIIRQAYFEDPAYVPLVLRAYELWEQVRRDAGRDVLTITGGLMIGAPDSRTVAGSVRSAEQWGLDHELLDAAQIRRRFPTMAPDDDTVGLYEPKAGFVVPESGVAAHLRLAERAGADLRYDEPVLEWRAGGGSVTVRTPDGAYTAAELVVCPGAWAPELLADLGVSFRVERYAQFFFAPTGGPGPYLPDRHPIFVWEGTGGRQFYGFPALGEPEPAAKVAFFRGGQPCTPDTIDRVVHPEEVEDMRAFVAPRIPTLPGRFVDAVTCMYTVSPDEHFIIARHPAHDRVTVACGFSGHGFKFASVVGEILADLAVDGSTSHPVELFDPRRLAPV
ncbi:MAG: N-methyl-L-tryptophan oxidase [Streptosporangiaceae bacterium]